MSRAPLALLGWLLVVGHARAQLPTAPPPHPALDEVVRECRRVGLPLPPPDAKPVRYRVDVAEFEVGFRAPSTKPGDGPRYWFGFRSWPPSYVHPDAFEEYAPRVADLPRINSDDDLFTSIHFQVLGRPEMARAVYARYVESGWRDDFRGAFGFGEYVYEKGKIRLVGDLPPQRREAMAAIHYHASRHWEAQLSVPGSDRREPLRRLQDLARTDPGVRPEIHRDLIAALELTLAPSTAKAGSVEALIDELTEYHSKGVEGEFGPIVHPLDGLEKLADRGFDAVPQLIEHLHDARLTREDDWSNLGKTFTARHVRVGDRVASLLEQLAGRPLGVDMFDPVQVRKWWAEVGPLGEEKWLLKMALDAESFESPDENRYRPGPLAPRLLRVKYPHRLAEVYRTILRKRPEISGANFPVEIVASTLPRAEKIALLKEGAAQKEFGERYTAILSLSELDRSAVAAPVLDALAAIEAESGEDPWELVMLTEASRSPDCWKALATAARKTPPEYRRRLMFIVGRRFEAGVSDPNRVDRLKFLLAFVDDRARVEEDRPTVGSAALDRVAMRTIFREFTAPDRWARNLDAAGPLSRLLFGAAARRLAWDEVKGVR